MTIRDLFTGVPFYTTRKTADGQTAAYTWPIIVAPIVSLLVCANVLLWGVVGIVTAIKVLL